jgi:hypothetical protein
MQWKQLPQVEQLGILLGNPTTYLLYSFPNTQSRKDWVSSLLLDINPHVRLIMERRATLISEYYPELT